jgi:hypothetical protein
LVSASLLEQHINIETIRLSITTSGIDYNPQSDLLNGLPSQLISGNSQLHHLRLPIMDPLSVLGAAAASSQLLQQGAKITKFLWDLHSKMKNSPETIHKEIVQIEQLIDLSRLFLQSPSLQKDSVASILGTCLLRAQEFDQELQKVSVHDSDGKFKKLKKTFEAVMKEKEIVQLFDQLEREKSSLMLCIQQIDK